MITLSDSKKSSRNLKSRTSHKKRKHRKQLEQNSKDDEHDEKYLSSEQEEKIEIDFPTDFKAEPESLIQLDIQGEIITCDTNLSDSQEQIAKTEINDTEQIKEEDPLFIKQEPIQVFFEGEANDNWLDSMINRKFSKCPACDAVFFEDNLLQDHMLIHSYKDKTPIYCTYCNFSTQNLQSFATHLNIHQNQCEVCNQDVGKTKNFEKHLHATKFLLNVKKDHMGNFVCTVCELSFDFKHQLQKHWFKHSCQESRTYQCNSCTALFDTEKNLENHRCLKCPICHETYANFPTLRSHTRYKKHYLYCDICSYEFSLQIDHDRHVELHKKKFVTNKRILYCLQAEDESTLQCEMCGKLLQTDSAFISHVKDEHNILVDKLYDSDDSGDDAVKTENPIPVKLFKANEEYIL